MEQERFVRLVKDLLHASQAGADAADLEDLAAFDFTSDAGLVCRVFPHDEQDLVMLEVKIAHLDFLKPDALGFQRLLLLHHINDAARWTNGIMASISQDMELVLSKSLDGRLIDGDALASEMALLLTAASDLREVWEGLDGKLVRDEEQGDDASLTPANYA